MFILVILITTIFSSIVVTRRKKYCHVVFCIDKAIMEGEDYEQERVNVPSVNLGAQPAMSVSSEA